MKRFYTTREQGKKLLELGVPIDTADCCYTSKDDISIMVLPDGTSFSEFNKSIERVIGDRLFPCWSGYALEYIDSALDCELAKDGMDPNHFDGLIQNYIEHVSFYKECGVDINILDKYTRK